VLVATIFGITSVSGALLGACFFVILPEVLREVGSGGGGFTGSEALTPLIIGLLAIAASRNTGGISAQLRTWVRERIGGWRAARAARPRPEPALTVPPVRTPGEVGADA
jgi:hypothetical protein